MTDKAVKKDTIKKHVRALLLSSPVPLTVNELTRDFHTFIGEPLNFRSMGYTTIEDFFRDIDDAVRIGWKNGSMTLTANADETTKHIERLVSKQKVNNKKKYAVYRKRGGYQGGPPRMYQGEAPRYQRSSRPGLPPQPPPMVPAYTRNQLKELFKSFPEGLPITHFTNAFANIYGTRLNFINYGFNNLYDFLKSLMDIVQLKDMSNGEVWISPVGYVRPLQVNSQKSTLAVGASRNRAISDSADRNNNSEARDNSYKYTWNNADEERKPTVTSPGFTSDNSEKRPSKGRGRRREDSGDSVGHDARSAGSSGSVESSKKCEDSTDRLEREIQQVLEKKPDGTWARRLPYEFSEVHGKALDFREHGYLSVIDFISSMPSIVRIERPSPQGDWMLYDARLPKPQVAEIEAPRQRHTSGRVIETETKEAIQKILRSHPSGIPVKDFPAIYQLFTYSALPIKELGFDGPEALFLSLADSILQMAYSGNGGFMLFSMDAEIPDMDAIPIQRSVPGNTHSPDYPEDVVGPGCHYTPVMCPEVEQYVELYVSNIINPGLFWVILRHKTKSLALETLMDNIDAIYNSTGDDYKMPEAAAVPGQVCATLFPEDNNWHRGVITGRNNAGFIEIYYVDYGNTTYVQKSTLRFLKSQFLTLPAQAIQARLANIHPPTGKWKVKSRNRMLELTREKALVAYVTDVKSQVMSLCLTDTSDPQFDLHINDVLQKEGHAMFQPDDQHPELLLSSHQHSEVPDYSHVFGWTDREVPRLPRAARGEDSQQAESDDHCYVRWLQLTKDHVIHLINLDRVAYVVSAEISSLLWEEDILTSMVKQKKMENVFKRVVSSEEYPQLFQDLTKYNVKSLKTDLLGKGQFLSLYALNSIPSILRVFQHESTELITAVEELATKFDPDNPYWKSCEVKSNEAVDEQEEEESCDMLSREEKQMALQALQFKRKRILQSLMNDPASAEKTVNELNFCELEIMMIKQELEKSQHKGTATVLSAGEPSSHQSSTAAVETRTSQSPVTGIQHVTGSDQSAENRRAIQNIMASTTKPIATANIMTKATTSYSAIRNPVSVTSSTQSLSMGDNFMTQSTAGSFPSMTGVNPFAQQQRFVNPLLLAQAQNAAMMANAGMPDMSAMMGANFGMGGSEMASNYNAGLMPQFNPLLAHLMQQQKQTLSNSGMTSLPNQMGDSLPSLGRGQHMQANSLGILPGLLPLLQNLNLGRGRGAGPGPYQ